MANLENKLKDSFEKVSQENYTFIKVIEERLAKEKEINDQFNKKVAGMEKENKTIQTKVIKVEEEIENKVDKTTAGDGMSIEEKHKLLKLKVFHLENELKKAVEKMVDLIKGIKEENIKRKEEIRLLKRK